MPSNLPKVSPSLPLSLPAVVATTLCAPRGKQRWGGSRPTPHWGWDRAPPPPNAIQALFFSIVDYRQTQPHLLLRRQSPPFPQTNSRPSPPEPLFAECSPKTQPTHPPLPISRSPSSLSPIAPTLPPPPPSPVLSIWVLSFEK
ncbi:hypothetical protein TIFTF001_012753 [Ficus carica]|uniref:Uncharacterized protein n=1 Tax=Ficus carica TaxID=3494 RepID=A0AA87ZZJ8_FICCA|nr:hypothetical protein TIFTF001_012753 [Ficus carica]